MYLNPVDTTGLQLLQVGGGLIIAGLGWTVIGPLLLLAGGLLGIMVILS